MAIFIGTAGWSIPRGLAHAFSVEGAALERYASRFRAVEINSSFYRPHRQSTWARWGSMVPDDFRFAVKIPKEITHQRRLVDCQEVLAKFVDEARCLGSKLAILLVQLPPSLAFDAGIAAKFFDLMAAATGTQVVCEPRHPSWFEPAPDAFLDARRVVRVAADPAPVLAAAHPGGWRGASYWRLHGSPQIYRSAYGEGQLKDYAALLQDEAGTGEAWCMFDNTASSAAIHDALALDALVQGNV